MRTLVLLLLLPLAACGMFRTTSTPDTPEQAECRSVARNSDAVRDIQRTLSIGDNDRIIADQVAMARERAFRTCLRERRLPGAGGVEQLPR